MRVEVYRNLLAKARRLPRWSARGCKSGRVEQRAEAMIVADAKFVVQPGGRARCLARKVRNVHALVRGELVPAPHPLFLVMDWELVAYDPYAAPYFYRVSDQAPVFSAKFVMFNESGCWAYKPVVLDTWAGAEVCGG